MSDASGPRVKKEAHVTCLSCGKTSLQFVLDRGDYGLAPIAPCPKCSNTAYTNNLQGLFRFMQAAAKDIAAIKIDMIDLQDDGEDR